MKRNLVLLILLITVFSCAKIQRQDSDDNTQNQESDGWIKLLESDKEDGWRAYNGDQLPPGWIIKDGVLSFDTELGMEQDYTGGIDIIYGKEEFENFELYLEWKLPEGGNSGIFYHLKEGYDGPAGICPEYQLIDDVNYARIHDLTEYNTSLGYENPSQLHPLQKTASDYAMYAADDDKKQLNPVGEWNSTKILFTPEKVEYWLNGKILVSFVPWSEDWNEKKNSGKWKDYPDYGKFKSGYIGLQDHSSPIWFRNIKVKKL